MKKSKMSELGFWALRLSVGAIFIYSGWLKLSNMDQTIGFFSAMGFPMATFSAWLVGLVEFVGGIAVVLGFAMHVAAVLLAITMAVASFTMLKKGFPMAFAPIALLGSTLALFSLGGGSCQLWKPKGCTGACCMTDGCGGKCGGSCEKDKKME